MAPDHRHPVELRAGPQAVEHVLHGAPVARHHAVEERQGPRARGGQVVEHGHDPRHARRAGLRGDERRVDRLGRHHQRPVPVVQDGGVVAVATQHGRDGRQLPLAAEAGVPANGLCESR